MTTKIDNKRKRSLYAKLIGLSFIIYHLSFSVACSDFLEIPSRSEIVLEEFWNEKADVDNIVAGCYSRMQSDDVVRRLIVWGECRADNVMAGINIDKDANLENVLKENITTKNPYTAWDGLYSVINRCNTVIKYAPGVAASDPGYTQSELKATIAEVSGLRDLCYFYLIRTFRNVPYSTEAFTDDDQIMDLPPTSFEVILDSLISDLESVQGNAIKRYPTNKSKYQTGRITRCAVWAMLCEMYLWKGDYDKCIYYADLVIEDKKELAKESSSYSMGQTTDQRLLGYPLVGSSTYSSSFGNYYRTIFIDGNSSETIFELLFDESRAGNTMLGNSAVGLFYGNSTVTKGYLAPSSSVISDAGKVNSRSVYADANYYADSRLYTNSNNNDESINKFVCRSVTISDNATRTSPPSVTYGSKFSYAKINNVDHHYNSAPWIIYRVPDIMLLKAEALCQKMREGSDSETNAYNAPLLTEAFKLVKAVNNRSICQQTSSMTDVLNERNFGTRATMEALVMAERQRELMFEGKRWYDLVRRSMRDGNTDELCRIMSRREGTNSQYVQNFFGSATTGMYAIFWPYNDEETKVNKNLADAQNPAFSSGESNISK
ncbi:MAG: RagB/SusD family nutrient uptake outer membrane protein [Prevotella sp.]|nr:RagB/SusD family nutrient uptake outer membrane protein [Prevotella sp.]